MWDTILAQTKELERQRRNTFADRGGDSGMNLRLSTKEMTIVSEHMGKGKINELSNEVKIR